VWLLTIAIFTAPFVVLLRLAATSPQRWWMVVVLVPSLYVLADALGTLIFSLVFVGSASTLGIDFSMGSPGYQLADSTFLRQVAWAGGLYGLLFVQAGFGVAGYYVLRATGRFRWWYRSSWLLVWVVLASNVLTIPSQTITTDAQTLTVGVVSTFDSEYIAATPAEQLAYGIFRLPATIDVVALPEDTRYLQYMNDERAAALQSHFENATVLDSGSIRTDEGLQPEIQVYHTATKQLATSSKEFLMVFGEYLPWLYRGVGYMFGLGDVIAKLDEEHRYVVTQPQLLPIQGIPVSIKLCSDAMSPTIYRRDTHDGAAILFNLASHGWFHHSQTLHDAAVRVGQVRAVENGRWYIRAGHDSPSVVIDQQGHIIVTRAWFNIEPLVVSVPVRQHTTLYSWLHIWVLLLPLGLVGLVYARQKRARIRADTGISQGGAD